RGIYFARQLGVTEPFTARLVDAAIDKLKVGYPSLEESRDFVKRAISAEEERFLRTLEVGSARLEHRLDALAEQGRTVLPGFEAFELYDTYGFPIELT